MDFLQQSVEIIKESQSKYGSFPASPNFKTYQYCWLRDGTFIAYALDLVGEHERSERFYNWVDSTLKRYSYKYKNLIEKQLRKEIIGTDEYFHTRYTLAGEEGQEPWGNFQLDGYGTYLWGLSQHIRLAGKNPILWVTSIETVIDYLLKFWWVPCFDCWEENENWVHPSTLGCIYGGLKEIIIDFDYKKDLVNNVLIQIKEKILTEYVEDGHFVKLPGSSEVDANLLWLSVPFGVIEPQHPLMRRTVEKIEEDLTDGGVKRYRTDTYYGGGQWVLLTAWLGWYYCKVGEWNKAKRCLKWVEDQFDGEGRLPEQVPYCLNSEEHYWKWVNKWGPIAKPLLWSHAMYIILKLAVMKA
ncbi:glycoside hydrolase family 15 protein [Calderihabitans maritimus]|uniref:Glycoside hydrolase 15-like protein n=1 Tax=Calderihabitans maritimus TaxID=1246530 RepID=A0A1Z5HWI6_9FIRM|nr:glycoside hydrolase family 15 protein [Calderihabitans maritimus]GAW93640.1 glycoside hydrolase 15-like protein [Calderihabitans maritimus]